MSERTSISEVDLRWGLMLPDGNGNLHARIPSPGQLLPVPEARVFCQTLEEEDNCWVGPGGKTRFSRVLKEGFLRPVMIDGVANRQGTTRGSITFHRFPVKEDGRISFIIPGPGEQFDGEFYDCLFTKLEEEFPKLKGEQLLWRWKGYLSFVAKVSDLQADTARRQQEQWAESLAKEACRQFEQELSQVDCGSPGYQETLARWQDSFAEFQRFLARIRHTKDGAVDQPVILIGDLENSVAFLRLLETEKTAFHDFWGALRIVRNQIRESAISFSSG